MRPRPRLRELALRAWMSASAIPMRKLSPSLFRSSRNGGRSIIDLAFAVSENIRNGSGVRNTGDLIFMVHGAIHFRLHAFDIRRYDGEGVLELLGITRLQEHRKSLAFCFLLFMPTRLLLLLTFGISYGNFFFF